MILTLKLPGLAFEINSAGTASSNGSREEICEALKSVGFMDVIHYSFGYMGVLTGKNKVAFHPPPPPFQMVPNTLSESIAL